MNLTPEQEETIDSIIEKNINNPQTDWVFDGEDSIEVDDVRETLRAAAKEIKEYLRSIKDEST